MSIIRVERHDTFVVMAKECLEQKTLSLKAKGLHAYLMTLPQDWRVRMKDLENRSTDGRESVRSAMKELLDSGYVTRSTVQGAGGKMDGIEYTIYETQSLLTERRENRQSVEPSDGKPAATNNTVILNNHNTKDTPHGDNSKPIRNSQQSIVLAAFDAFWASYPRKVGKTAALKAYKQVLKEVPDNILDILALHKRQEQWIKDNGQFIPHAATWLRNKRWEDEIKGVAPKQATNNDSDYVRKVLGL